MSPGPNAPRALNADEAWRPIIDLVNSSHSPAGVDPLRAAGLVVDSVFTNSVNIANGDDLLSLVTSAGRHSPGAMTTTLTDFRSVRQGAPIGASKGALTVGNLVIDLAGVTHFDCRIAAAEISVSSLPAALRLILEDLAQSGSFATEAGDTPFRRAIASRLISSREAFRRELRQTIQAHSLSTRTATSDQAADCPLDGAIGELIGLGFGLTPSGDDYLVGTLAALTLADIDQARTAHEALIGRISARTNPSVDPAATTVVSRHFLRAACRGEFHQDLAEAGRAVLSNSPSAPDAIAQAAAIGSTSGTDALIGLFDTIEVLLEFEPTPLAS